MSEELKSCKICGALPTVIFVHEFDQPSMLDHWQAGCHHYAGVPMSLIRVNSDSREEVIRLWNDWNEQPDLDFAVGKALTRRNQDILKLLEKIKAESLRTSQAIEICGASTLLTDAIIQNCKVLKLIIDAIDRVS